MMCRTTVDGSPLGEKLSTLTVKDLEQVRQYKRIIESNIYIMQSHGTTNEASKYARHCYLVMLDYHGLNYLFLITTPDSECSFRVRLHAKPRDWLSALLDKLFYFGIICLTSILPIELTNINFLLLHR